MSRIDQLKALSSQEWKALLAAFWLLPLTAAMLRLKGVQKTRRTLNRKRFTPGRQPLHRPGTVHEALKIARMVNVAANRRVYRANCLTRSVVLETLLMNQGIDCELKFGTRADTEVFSAHAWVECGGMALADPGSENPAIRTLI
jgi:hypothetical protein